MRENLQELWNRVMVGPESCSAFQAFDDVTHRHFHETI